VNLSERFESALPESTKQWLRRLGELASDAHLVGGPLRDLLLNRPVVDFDIVVHDGITVARAFASDEGLTVSKTHASFGTATVLAPDGTRFDFVTARRERYPSPAVLPMVEPGSLEDDLRRRDFSINALAMCLHPDDFGDVRDAVNGLDDLRNGVVRALHPLSFIDDPTRIFRAYRFAERFGFTLEPQTETWIRASVRDGHLARLSGARVRHELVTLLREPRRVDAFRRLRDLGALDALAEPCPCDDATLDGWDRLERRLPSGRSDMEPFVLAWFSRWSTDRALRVAAWLNLDAPTAQAIRAVSERREDAYRAASDPTTPRSVWHRLLADLTENVVFALASDWDDGSFDALRRHYADARDARRLVTGDDLLAIGMAPGPNMRCVLDATFEAQLDGRIRTREEALDFARQESLRLRDEQRTSSVVSGF
jgi:tRNA nucleotidyltransferase (CCA-adding enzyme)